MHFFQRRDEHRLHQVDQSSRHLSDVTSVNASYRSHPHTRLQFNNNNSVFLSLPLCADNPGFHADTERNSLWKREAARTIKYIDIMLSVFS